MRYEVTCDAIHKSIQSLSEWYFPGKDLLEQTEVVQNDATQESYKSMLLFQVAELVQMALLLKLKKLSGSETPTAELKQFRSMARMIERVHKVNLHLQNDMG